MRVLALLFVLSTLPAAAQQTPPSCDTADHALMNFWVGEWDLTWDNGDGSQGSGTNTITRSYNGCVIEESFVDPTGFEGMSVSTLDRRTGQWRQTWVDNQSAFLLFTGSQLENGEMEFRSPPFTDQQGNARINRMTWRNVTEESFDWHWQTSTDDGAIWSDLWVIHYERR